MSLSPKAVVVFQTATEHAVGRAGVVREELVPGRIHVDEEVVQAQRHELAALEGLEAEPLPARAACPALGVPRGEIMPFLEDAVHCCFLLFGVGQRVSPMRGDLESRPRTAVSVLCRNQSGPIEKSAKKNGWPSAS